MRRLGNALLVTMLTCGLVATPVFAEPSIDSLKKNKEAAQSEVNSLQKELTDLMSKISKLEGDLIAKGQEITQAEEDLTIAQAKEEEQYEDMKLRIKFMYEEGDSSFIETLMSAENFSDLVNKAEYVQNVHSYDRDKLNEYIETKKQVQDLKATLETEMSNLEALQVEFEEQKDTLDNTIESKKDEISNLDEQIQIAVQKAAEEQRKREEAARKKAEEEQRAAAARTQSGQGQAAGNQGTTAGTLATPATTPNSGATASISTTVSNSSGSSGTSTAGGNTSIAQKIVSAAYSQLGVPYVWGGSSPGVGLDCSGLVQYCHAVAGISLPHYSESQYAGGQKVTNPQPGDICWKPGHVGIYVGNGQMIEAQQTGTNIMVSAVRAQGYARYW